MERNWRNQFPGYEVPPEVEALVKSGLLADESWKNDSAPRFMHHFGPGGTEDKAKLYLWVEHPKLSERESGRTRRFLLELRDPDNFQVMHAELDNAHEVSELARWMIKWGTDNIKEKAEGQRKTKVISEQEVKAAKEAAKQQALEFILSKDYEIFNEEHVQFIIDGIEIEPDEFWDDPSRARYETALMDGINEAESVVLDAIDSALGRGPILTID